MEASGYREIMTDRVVNGEECPECHVDWGVVRDNLNLSEQIGSENFNYALSIIFNCPTCHDRFTQQIRVLDQILTRRKSSGIGFELKE